MKKVLLMTVTLFSCIFLSGCSGSADRDEDTWRGIQGGMSDLSAITERTEYYDIAVEQEPIFLRQQEKGEPSQTAEKARLVGMQFYQGEPVQLWQEQNRSQQGGALSCELCLYRPDGSREVLLQGIEPSSRHQGCLDWEGNLYWWENSTRREYPNGGTEEIGAVLMKYSAAGELIFERQYDCGVDLKEICQAADGRIYLILGQTGTEGGRRLAKLDPAAGLVTEIEDALGAEQPLHSLKLGTWGDKPAVFKFRSTLGNEIAVINVEDGSEDCILSFLGTSYRTPEGYDLQDFRILEDGSVELLWASWDGSKGLQENLRMEKVDKIPIVLRGNISELIWLEKQIHEFNLRNETYHIIVEDCGQENDAEDFARLTSVQIASGKGPDILCGSLMEDYIPGMLKTGAFEDLRPFMERSGIREEDYFPFVFDIWRDGDKIYGISPVSPGLEGYCMDGSVLGGTREPDMESLADALLSGQADRTFLKGYDSRRLLELLLKGSETLWGTVDWKQGSCDFGGELLGKILEVSKRYGDNGENRETGCIAEGRSYGAIYIFDDRQEREKKGKVICGVLFDDGCHPAVQPDSALAINANSPNKEGVWEFFSFLLGEEAQSGSGGVPVSRRAFDAWAEGQKEQFAGGREIHLSHRETLSDGTSVIVGEFVYTEADVSDEIVEEYRGMMEDARPIPICTAPILAIISEEAGDYFQGNKSPEEVSRLITNRVQLYLDEGK